MKLDTTTVISIISLGVAILSLYKASKAQKLQDRINEIELQIKKHDLEVIKQEEIDKQTACVEARLINIGNGKHKLKVWNSGHRTAYDVCVDVSDAAKIIVIDRGITPFDELEPGKSFDMYVIVHGGSAPKFKITTTWKNKAGELQEKVQMGSL